MTAQKVYILGPTRDGPLKIGISSDAEQRRQNLQVAHPEKLTVYWVGGCSHGLFYERHMHRALAPWRLQGEWFAVPLEKAFMAFLLVHDLADQLDKGDPDETRFIAEAMGWPPREKSA